MAATATFATTLFSLLSLSTSASSGHFYSKLTQPMLFLFFFICTFSLLSLYILISFPFRRKLEKTEQPNSKSVSECCRPPNFVDKTQQAQKSELTGSLLLEILPSSSSKWVTLFSGEDEEREREGDGLDRNGSGVDREKVDSGGEECGKKKRKKRAKKKRSSSPNLMAEKEREIVKEESELVCLYPFTSSSSATQRKIKQQYDQLVKSNGLTLAQVGQFVNVLIEARSELQHKSGVIQRKFTITKALLLKADRSSFDRLRQQIYKLDLEQKRLEEDVFVYNWLQQQLKLSPAYKKMLEIGACMELKAKSGQLVENTDSEFDDISFEELLAQEKKDSFWQKNGKPRSCSG